MSMRGTAARIDATAAKKNSGRPCCVVILLAGALSVVAVLTQGVLLAQWQVNTGGFARRGAGSMRYGGLYTASGPALPSQNRFARQADGFLPSENRGRYLQRGPLPSASGYTQWGRGPARPGSMRYAAMTRPVHSPQALAAGQWARTVAPGAYAASPLVRRTPAPVGSAFPGRIEPRNVFAAPTQTGLSRSMLSRAGSVSRTRPVTPPSIRYADRMAGRTPSLARPVAPTRSMLTSTRRPGSSFSPRRPNASIRYPGR
jgi:hypothetical protein